MSFWNEEIIKEAEKEQSFEPIPEGEYTMLLTDATLKDTKSGTGSYLNCKMEITGPERKGAVVFMKFNVRNDNSQAVSIGLGQLKQFSESCGKLAWYEDLKTATDWDDAKRKLDTIFNACGNTPVSGKVVIKSREGYEPSNEIKRFKAASGNAPSSIVADASKKSSGKKANPWD